MEVVRKGKHSGECVVQFPSSENETILSRFYWIIFFSKLREGVHPLLIHVNVWQKLLQYC